MADEELTNPQEEATEMVAPENLPDAFEEPRNEGEEENTPSAQPGFRIASLRDRAASGFFDLLVLFYVYTGTFLVYNYIVWREWLRPFPAQSGHLYIFHAVFLLLCFLYFFISEGVFFTSLGKFFGRLSVRTKNGETASLIAVIVRNLLRPLDYLLLIWPTWILLEKTPQRRRLGDLLAGTAVYKHPSRPSRHWTAAENTASATVRLLSGFIDFLLSAAWIGGICLLIDYQRPLFSCLVILLLPIFYLLWNLLWEALFNTTFGQWLFGCQLSREDGAPVGFTEVLLRAAFKIFDTNPLGWMILYLSARNQKPSDLAAGTFVVHAKRSWKVLIALGLSLAAIAAVWAVGLGNPRNFFTPFFKIDFVPKIFSVRTGGVSAGLGPAAGRSLFIPRFSFILQDRKTLRPGAEYKPGETIYFSFDVTGFAVRNKEAWIQEDLTVQYPDNALGFKQENIVDFRQMLKNPETPLEIVNTLALPQNAQPGHYTLVITLHDRFGNRHLTEQRTFRITP